MIDNVELARSNHQVCADGLVAVGSECKKNRSEPFVVERDWHMIRDCRHRHGYVQNNHTSGWSGTDDKAKRQEETRQKQKQGEAKGKIKNKGEGKHLVKKGTKGFHEMEGNAQAQDTQTTQDDTEWTDIRWNNLDNWDDDDRRTEPRFLG